MGRTYKDNKDKSDRPFKRLNNHRDQPDMDDLNNYDEDGLPLDDDEEAYKYYADRLPDQGKPTS